jgi:hypothetical protein
VPLLVRGVAGVLALALAAGVLAGCAGHGPRPAALRLERSDLVTVARTLRDLQDPVGSEVAAARAVWPTLAYGLSASRAAAPATRSGIARAYAHVRAFALPAIFTTEGALTGPAAGIGGLVKRYAILTRRGWSITAAASTTRPANFLRANSGLYIYCIYDGHFDLSLVGTKLLGAYRKLGGPAAFGAALTTAQVQALARAYSIPAIRLEPHPVPAVHV